MNNLNQEAFFKSIPRRSLTISGVTLGFILAWTLLPIWLPVSLLVDLYRWKRRAPITRFLAALTWIATFEVMGVICSIFAMVYRLMFWDKARAKKYHYVNLLLQLYWAKYIFAGIKFIYDLKIKTINEQDAVATPMILLLRHSSIADVVLCNELVAVRSLIAFRYIIKRQLRWDPCIDIVAPRLGCLFVDRNAQDSKSEIEKVGRMAHNLGPHEGVLLYPEGTRFTERKKHRLLQKLLTHQNKKLYQYADSLRNVLPPKLGGVLELLEQNNNADVVFCAHSGFEGMANLNHFLDGKAIGVTIRAWFWRVPFAQIPKTVEQRQEWILEQWKLMDTRVEQLMYSG